MDAWSALETQRDNGLSHLHLIPLSESSSHFLSRCQNERKKKMAPKVPAISGLANKRGLQVSIYREPRLAVCDDLQRWDGRGREAQDGENYICVCVCVCIIKCIIKYIYKIMADSHCCIAKPTQYCKAIILQLEKYIESLPFFQTSAWTFFCQQGPLCSSLD